MGDHILNAVTTLIELFLADSPNSRDLLKLITTTGAVHFYT